jgi:hypothetical protein
MSDPCGEELPAYDANRRRQGLERLNHHWLPNHKVPHRLVRPDGVQKPHFGGDLRGEVGECDRRVIAAEFDPASPSPLSSAPLDHQITSSC